VSEERKAAYRHLLYIAMLFIRNVCTSRAKPSISPLLIYEKYKWSIAAGAVAEWMHNLADFSVRDFEGFDEELFWSEITYLGPRFKQVNFQRYKEVFESYLRGEIKLC
jgi:hypothetical protein